jgi:serine/threonine protein kinase
VIFKEAKVTEFEGRTIGGYQLIEIIDRGGRSFVFKGFQPKMNRYVAVKVLSPAASDDMAIVEQFKQQGELLGQMTHRNILPIYDTGQDGKVVYRASRYVETGTVRDQLSRFYDARQAQQIIFYIAEALDYIHGRGYIHGNLKPGNIFLDEQNRPLLTDFGFAQRLGAVPSVYNSPEQTEGGAVDRRTDIYALGVLLYEMLVGEPPESGVVASPRAKRPDLPAEVDTVVFKAMAQNPDDRFQSANEFSRAMQTALRPKTPPTQPVQTQQAQPAPTPTPAPPPKRENSWLVFLLGGAFVFILIICGILFAMGAFGDGDDGTGAPPTEVVQPTEPVPEVPTAVPTEPQDPEVELPIAPTGEAGAGEAIGDLCGSAGLIVAGVVFSLGLSRRRWRKKEIPPDW